MGFPSFATGEVLTAADMNAVGLWRVTSCTVSSVGGTAATASNGVITVGTGNTSVTVSNAFSADYDSYKILYTGGTGSTATTALSLQIGNAITGYYSSTVYFPHNAAAGTQAFGVADNNNTRWLYVGSASTTAAKMSVEVYAPFLSAATSFGAHYNEFGTTANSGHSSGYLNNTNSYTAFTMLVGAGTITGGQIRVYGYRD